MLKRRRKRARGIVVFESLRRREANHWGRMREVEKGRRKGEAITLSVQHSGV